MFGFKNAERVGVGASLGEAFEFVGAGIRRMQEDGLRVPGVAFEDAGGGMVAGDGEHVGLFAQEQRERGVEFGDGVGLGGEVAVFAAHVGVFVVDEEVIVVVVFGEVPLELLGDGLRAFELGHADELGEALVHGINGDLADV